MNVIIKGTIQYKSSGLASLILDIITLGSSNSAPGSEVGIENIFVKNQEVALMSWEGVIKLWGQFSDLGESGPGDIGEVMMLNMISDVEVEEIEGTIVRIGVLALDELVMFSNNVERDGIKSKSEESSWNEIEESSNSKEVEDGKIPQDDNDEVDDLHKIGGLGGNNIWSQTIEQWHNAEENELFKASSEKSDFPLGR